MEQKDQTAFFHSSKILGSHFCQRVCGCKLAGAFVYETPYQERNSDKLKMADGELATQSIDNNNGAYSSDGEKKKIKKLKQKDKKQ